MTRKQAHAQGLRNLARKRAAVYAIRPSLYNAAGMVEPNQIVCGDCIKILNDGPEGWIDLVFADPPFNIGYLYHGYDDRRKTEDYLQFSTDWMKAVHRALKPNGSFYLAIGDDYAADLCVIARRQIGFHLRNWIIWHYTFGQQPKAKFARSHTHILYFTKHEKDFTFNADRVRVPSARQTTYADARANPKGKLPDDVWFLRPQEADPAMFDPTADTWYVSRVCGTFKEREGWHGCQMPIAVLDRIIKSSSNPDDIVVDPFNGSGTTVVSAALLGRKYVGIDQSEAYVAYARKRLEHALEKGSGANGKAVLAAITDPKRASKVMTETDAFGRKRVTRRRAARSA
ncbi:MAG TPA: site-specific DNA-methyltransferase [Tepidisphaeraceae bacterium]|nr:site-specific DNA-methyltransferase [Tepidisphaeraceae bacterium]